MHMTMAEKVLARAAGRSSAAAGQFVTVRPDRLMVHEAFAACNWILKSAGVKKLHDPDRVVVILDHYFPAPTASMADVHVMIRRAVEEFGIEAYLGYEGVCHQVMCESGNVMPGLLILGTDSHTTTYGALGAGGTGIGQTEMSYVMATGSLWMMVPPTIRFDLTGRPAFGVMSKDVILYIAGAYGTEAAQYRSVEFSGQAARSMSLSERMTMCNMGVEIGAKFAFFEADEMTAAYVRERTGYSAAPFGPDEGAVYEAVHSVDVGEIPPQVALPHNPGNVGPVVDAGNVSVDQAYLGSCTNGRIEDIAVAARILKGRNVHPKTRLLIAPASKDVMLAAVKLGYAEDLLTAGGHFLPAGCGACPGSHMGLLGKGESCISSTNRNFRGRMGSEDARVYLGSPATVAASAVTGRLTDPREFLQEKAGE
ncbi:MAG: aconitase/3-isopropylmalate dehydratase large subunit family protein [Desulfobacterales bacterium]